jgi:hypothetical protein
MMTSKDSYEEVESPHIMGLNSTAFGSSSSSGKNGAEGDGSSGHKKVEEKERETMPRAEVGLVVKN